MNRGQIPGFYFDPQKQKYFKIEKNQYAPEDAPYSQQQVMRAKRIRQQKEERRKIRVAHEKANQIVRRSRLLQSAAVTGVALEREHGISGSPHIRHRIGSAVVSQWRPQPLVLDWGSSPKADRNMSFLDAHYIPQSDTLLASVSSSRYFDSGVYLCEEGSSSEKGSVVRPTITVDDSTDTAISTALFPRRGGPLRVLIYKRISQHYDVKIATVSEDIRKRPTLQPVALGNTEFDG
jgi:hypothetical protein